MLFDYLTANKNRMTFLQSIATVVTKYVSNKLDIIHSDLPKTGKENSYEKGLRLLMEGIAPDDKYRQDYPDYIKSSASFRKYESRLRKKLLNMLLLVDVSGTRMSPMLKAELDCLKMIYQARLLTALYERAAGIDIAKKVCTISEKMGLAGTMVAGLAILRKEAAETGNDVELTELQAQSAMWIDRMAAEDRAKGYYELMDVHYAKSISQKPWLAEKAFEWANLVEKDLKQHDSHILNYEKFKLMYAGHHCAKEYKEAVADMEALKAYMDNHKDFASDTRYAEIALHKLDCFMHLKEYWDGRECADMCLKYFWPGSANRLYFMELYFLFTMLTGEYNLAGGIISEARKDPYFEGLENIHKEKWLLYNAYYEYATKTSDINKKFSVVRFINDYGTLAHDKSGHNAAIYIMAWCMQVRSNVGAITGSADALRKYRSRYLGQSQNIRLNLFIQLMETADRLDYRYLEILEQAADIVIELQNTPIQEYTGNFEGVEIIPLDKLWSMQIQDMKKYIK